MTELSESHDDPFALHLPALAVLDDRGVVVGWNRRAQELLGHPDTAVIGRPAFEVLVDPRDLPAVTEAAANCRRAGGWFGVLTLRHRDGRLVELGLSGPRSCHATAGVREWFLAGALAADVLEWQRDRAVLDGLYRQCPIGLVIHGPDLRILRGQPGHRTLQRRPGSRLSGAAHRPDASPRRRTQGCGPCAPGDGHRKAPWSTPSSSFDWQRDPARERVALVSSFRMEDPSGRILGVAEMIEDITPNAIGHSAGSRSSTRSAAVSEPPSTWPRPPGNSPR